MQEGLFGAGQGEWSPRCPDWDQDGWEADSRQEEWGKGPGDPWFVEAERWC